MGRSASAMGGIGGGLGKFAELRQRLLFVVGALIVYRIGCYIPVPGVDPEAMTRLIGDQGGIVDMFNMFSGGALERFSLFALNVIPYISSSIIIQLCAQIFPTLKAMQKEGESGRKKITQYSRIGAVVLAVFQAAGIAAALQGQAGVVYNPGPGFIMTAVIALTAGTTFLMWLGEQVTERGVGNGVSLIIFAGIAIALQGSGAANGMPVVYAPGMGFVMTAVVSLTAGTMFLMWLGEQVTERGVGNGVSLIIFAGIVAGLPSAVLGTLTQARNGDMAWITVFFILAIVAAVTYFVVFVERGQRRITVNYARRQGGRSAYMNQTSFLPLKLNMSGVIPAIFASSIIMFPATASTWFGQAGEGGSATLLQRAAQALSVVLVVVAFALLMFVRALLRRWFERSEDAP